MYALRYILPAAASVRLVLAQCDGPTTTIQNSGDASGLASCQTYSGSITIATQAADQIDINTLRGIDGDLNVVAANDLSGIGADSLQTITGTFKLQGVRQLTSLSFPKLTEVGALEWSTLPALNGLEFDTGITTAKSIQIRDTQLQDLTGISLQEVDSFTVQSNGILSNVSLDLETINDDFTLSENGQDLTLSLAKLTKAKNLILQGCSTIDISALEEVGGALDVESGGFETFEAEKLTEVGSTLTIQKNENLSGLKLPLLKTCGGGFVIAANDKLEEISGLDKLETISGNLDFTGSFTKVDLPNLNSVKGAFNMQSKEDIQKICDDFSPQAGRDKPFRGKFTCKSKQQNPTSIGGGNGSGDDNDSDFGMSLQVPAGAVMICAGAAAFGLL